MISPDLSNHYNNAVSVRVGPNNVVEGWHNDVTSLFQGSQPSIHTCLEQLQRDSFNQRFNNMKASNGSTNQTRTKNRELNKKSLDNL